MVRRRIEIKRIEDKAKRHTTFTKRRQGLFKKAKHLCRKYGAQIAVVVFSLASNVYAFGNPSVESLVRRRAEELTSSEAANNINERVHELDQDVIMERKEEEEIKDEVDELQEIDQIKAVLEEMKMNVQSRSKEITNPESIEKTP